VLRRPALVALLLCAGCGGGGEPDPFAYEPSAPLFASVSDEQSAGGIEIVDASFAAAGGRVAVWLVSPRRPGPHPVILFQHGGGSSRDDFLEEAGALAERGATGILLQAPDRPSVRGGVVANVVAWRRVLDWVEEQQRLDASRIAFVGISYGAGIAADLAGADGRVSTYVLMSGPPRWRGAGVSDLEPEDWVGKSDARFLFQVGRRDDVVAPADAQQLYDAAPEAKELRRYDAGHVLNRAAQQDRIRWLSARLGLG
jgi:predicted esterase